MKTSSEFNKIENQNTQQRNNAYYSLQNDFEKYQNKVEQQTSIQEINEKKVEEIKPKETAENIKEKSTVISKILTTVVAVVSATVIGVTNIEGLLPPSTTLVAYFEELEATNTEIYYGLWIEDSRTSEKDEPREEDEYYVDLSNVYVVLANDFTNRSEKIEEQWWSGSFENLQKNMEYTISVYVGDVLIASQTIKTTNEDEPITSDDPNQNPTGGG